MFPGCFSAGRLHGTFSGHCAVIQFAPCHAVMWPCLQDDKHMVKLVYDMTLPESLPFGWSSEFDASGNTWCEGVLFCGDGP